MNSFRDFTTGLIRSPFMFSQRSSIWVKPANFWIAGLLLLPFRAVILEQEAPDSKGRNWIIKYKFYDPLKYFFHLIAINKAFGLINCSSNYSKSILMKNYLPTIQDGRRNEETWDRNVSWGSRFAWVLKHE